MLKVPETMETEKFIIDNSKIDDKGVRTVPQSGYLSYMETMHAITPETVKAMSTAEQALVSGAIAVGTRDLADMIESAKKAGEDPTDLCSMVKVARPAGQLKVGVAASATVPNPKTGERTTRHGVVTVRARTSTLIDDEVVKRTQETIAGMMGG